MRFKSLQFNIHIRAGFIKKLEEVLRIFEALLFVRPAEVLLKTDNPVVTTVILAVLASIYINSIKQEVPYMKIINKRPNYIKSSDRIKKINHAYTIVFRAINKIDREIKSDTTKSMK